MKRSPIRRKSELKRSAWRPEGVVLQRKTKLKARYKPISVGVRYLVNARAQGLCELCGTWVEEGNRAYHHRKRRSQGGKDTAENLRYLHSEPCHLTTIHGHPEWAYRMGWMLRGNRTGEGE